MHRELSFDTPQGLLWDDDDALRRHITNGRGQRVWSLGDPRCHINAFLWFLTSRAFVWYQTWLILTKFEKSENIDGRGPEMTLLHIGWRGKLRGWFWGPIWAPWKWNYIFGNYFPRSSFLCTILLDYTCNYNYYWRCLSSNATSYLSCFS